MAKINMKQVFGTVKTIVTKAAPVIKVVGGAALAGAAICVGVKHYNDRHNAVDDETMEDLEPIDEIVEEVNE